MYSLMGIASWIVWQSGQPCTLALLAYAALVAATWLAWPPLLATPGGWGFPLDTAGGALVHPVQGARAQPTSCAACSLRCDRCPCTPAG